MPVANFYLPTTRIWELLIGALLAGVALDPKRARSAIRADVRESAGRRRPRGDLLLAECSLTKDADCSPAGGRCCRPSAPPR